MRSLMGCRNLIAFRRMGTGKENCALVPNPAFERTSRRQRFGSVTRRGGGPPLNFHVGPHKPASAAFR